MKTLNEMREELRILEMHEPIVRQFAQLELYEGLDHEQALIGMVLTLADKCKNLERHYIEHLNRCTTPVIRSERG